MLCLCALPFLQDATSTAGERFKELRTSMDGLTIQDMLDGSWKDYMPNNWDKFSLEDLAIFDINNYLPEGDFSSWPPTKPDGTPYDYEDLMTSYDDLISDFCTDEVRSICRVSFSVYIPHVLLLFLWKLCCSSFIHPSHRHMNTMLAAIVCRITHQARRYPLAALVPLSPLPCCLRCALWTRKPRNSFASPPSWSSPNFLSLAT